MSGSIDLATWKRREHYELFRRASQPWFSVTSEVDVTVARLKCAESGASFFLTALYACLRAANETEAFRLRLRQDGVWLHDEVGITSTILRHDETFGFARFELHHSRDEFARVGAAEIRRAKQATQLEVPRDLDDALIYHSSIPWLRFTSFTNAITSRHDSVPRIVFGRCVTRKHGAVMPVAVETHHAVVDGIDVARFYERLEQHLADHGSPGTAPTPG